MMLKKIAAKASSFLRKELEGQCSSLRADIAATTQQVATAQADIAFTREQTATMQADIAAIKELQLMGRVEKFLLSPCSDPLSQKGITKEFLRSVEVGIHSFCNRRCWFCANNGKVDRHSEKIDMPDDVFLKILHDLEEIEYDGQISFHRFNEPLADKELILKRLSQVKAILPHCSPCIYTNGDYLSDNGYLDELINPSSGGGGVSWVFISLYLNKNENFFDEKAIAAKYESFLGRVKAEHTQPVWNQSENRFECHLTDQYEGKAIVVIPNFAESAFTMAGAVETGRRQVRHKPCSQPFGGLWIDYHGYVMPCCVMRYDVEEHSYATLGNVRDQSIFELFCGERITDFRKQVKNYGPKNGACEYCDLHGEWMEQWAPIY